MAKALAAMQPYFLPYLGYFQLMSSVDIFVLQNNVKYTKKGWINRNRILLDGKPECITLSLVKDSDYSPISTRSISREFQPRKMMRKIQEAYSKAPFIECTIELLSSILFYEDRNLFAFLKHSIERMQDWLSIPTRLEVASDIGIDHSLHRQDRLIALCHYFGAKKYINAPGGTSLYSKKDFSQSGIDLVFIQPQLDVYKQFDNPFIPGLSIIDLLMFNSVDVIRAAVKKGAYA